MPKRIEELRGATPDRKCHRRMKVIMKDGRITEVGISPLTKGRFPSVKRVQRAKENYHRWKSSQEAKRAFNRDQWLAGEL